MRVGVVLPERPPMGAALLDWAQRVEAAGFAALAVIERPGLPVGEPLTVVAALAAGTRRVGLVAALREVREGALHERDLRTLRELAGPRLALTRLSGSVLEPVEAEVAPVRRALVPAGAELAGALRELEAAGFQEVYVEPAGPGASDLEGLRRLLR